MKDQHYKKDEPTYLASFQQGYKLRQYSPEIFDLLKPSLDPSIPWHQALLDGAKQYEATLTQEQAKLAELDDLRDSKTKENDLEK